MLSDAPSPTTIALLQSNSLPMLVQKEIERLILAGERMLHGNVEIRRIGP
ncbi:MAG TPA: hypothetical protein VK138_05540 [Acidiferrobacterales bacterium]|nr:hypothetical protein [Acidiferrobacterales bacterium]